MSSNNNNEQNQELIDYVSTNMPWVNAIDLERWIETTSNNIRSKFKLLRPDLTSEKLTSKINKELKYLIEKKKIISNYEASIIFASENNIVKMNSEAEVVSSRDVVADKIFMNSDTIPDYPESRRKHLINFAEGEFLERMSQYGLQPLTTAMGLMNNKESKNHPWLKPYIGGLYRDQNKKVYAVNYDFPKNSDAALKKLSDNSEVNQVSLALNAEFIREMTGIEVDSHITVICDYEDNLSITMKHQNISDKFRSHVIDVIDHYYNNHILTNSLPMIDFGTAKYNRVDEAPSYLQDSVRLISYYHSLSKLADDRLKFHRKKFVEGLDLAGIEHTNADNKIKNVVGAISYTTSPASTINKSQIIKYLSDKGIEIPDKPMSHNDILLNLYAENGGDMENPDLYISTVSTRFNVSNKSEEICDIKGALDDLDCEFRETVGSVVGFSEFQGEEAVSKDDIIEEANNNLSNQLNAEQEIPSNQNNGYAEDFDF